MSTLTVAAHPCADNTTPFEDTRILRDGRGDSVAPERSLRQRMDALQGANHIRIYRARAKRDIKAGRGRTVLQILLAPRAEEETWKAFEIILALPQVGRVKANKVLQTARISPSKTVGGMSERQRAELIVLLGSRAG